MTAGIDMGAKITKVVIIGDSQIQSQSWLMTGREKEKLAEQAFDEALEEG